MTIQRRTFEDTPGAAPWPDDYSALDLGPYRNNIGITPAWSTKAGRLNVWGNSLPAEELPGGEAIVVNDVPFQFPGTLPGEPDNVRCTGQFVPVPPGRYDWLYLLAAAERRTEDVMAFHFEDGAVDFEPLRVSDFWHAPAVFGEDEAFATSVMHYPHHVQERVSGKIFCQRVPVTRRAVLLAVRFPDNVAVHVFAASLRR
ncbi:hypothetical protein AB0L65_17030 [Nonomuraea sp. NPDC052116]|uniref:hypothetical protein n=1 Tax=Nonomuraea sp. NPDC052116 TaxID=3155665 RepID=UPI003417F833